VTTGHRPNVRGHPVGVRPLQVLGEDPLGAWRDTHYEGVQRGTAGKGDPATDSDGEWWVDNDLVFATRYGTELDAANVRRAFQVLDALSRLVDGRGGCRCFAGSGVDTGCGRASFRCYAAQLWRSRTLRTWWAMPARMSPRRFIARSFEPVLTCGCNGHGCVIWWPSSWSVRLAV
jgi:hypothetical protein